MALRCAALAHLASLRSPQPGVARSAIRRHSAVRHGPERKGRPVSRGAGPTRARRRLSLGPSPEPCGQGGRSGKPLSPRSAARWIAEGIAKAGLQAVATGTGVKSPAFHSLRHSCARHWLQSGLNVNAVSARLGHSSPTVTLDTYLVLARTPWGTSAGLRNLCCGNHMRYPVF